MVDVTESASEQGGKVGIALRGKKAQKTLEHIGLMSGVAGMYPGVRTEDVSRKVGYRLYQEGLIRLFIPHNPAHKERWVITEAGRNAMSQ